MPIRFNMQELIDDLVAEGVTRSSAIAIARAENKRRQRKTLTHIIARNNSLMERTKIIPKIFT